ncbi:MAG: hypothetical protein Q8S84_08970 [bacterium]|nr:hypothetical protein [bacterium]MDP3381557.1 hypothetical protein [bacterium]
MNDNIAAGTRFNNLVSEICTGIVFNIVLILAILLLELALFKSASIFCNLLLIFLSSFQYIFLNLKNKNVFNSHNENFKNISFLSNEILFDLIDLNSSFFIKSTNILDEVLSTFSNIKGRLFLNILYSNKFIKSIYK